MEVVMPGRTLKALTLLTAVLAVGEFISAVIIAVEDYHDSQPAFGVVFGVLFTVTTWLLRSGRLTAGTAIAGILCLFEVVSYPGWQRHNALDWAFQTAYATVALTALATAAALFVTRRRAATVIA
jgi:hypothetical protein